jgi:hypothetical protein
LRAEALDQAPKSWIALEDVIAHSPPDAAFTYSNPASLQFALAAFTAHGAKRPFGDAAEKLSAAE